MNLTTIFPKSKSDIFGVYASSLCMVHCMATPLIFVVQASTTRCSEIGPWWWRTLDYLFLIISFFAINYSAKATSLGWMPKAMFITWGFLAVIIINESVHALPIPHLLIYLPAFSLVFLHLYKYSISCILLHILSSKEKFVCSSLLQGTDY